MSETILSLSEFKADPSRLLDNIRVEPTTLVLTQNGRARAWSRTTSSTRNGSGPIS